MPFEETIWLHRNDGNTFSNVFYAPGATAIGENFRGHDGCQANPPWNWPFTRPLPGVPFFSFPVGKWFFDPAGYYLVPSPYIHNPFFAPSVGELINFPTACPN